MSRLQFFVPGIPVQQGNHRRNVHGATYETSKDHRPWRDSVVWAARQARPQEASGRALFAGPISVNLIFCYPRPRSHYGTGRNAGRVKSGAPHYKVTAPDIDKLCRSALDAFAVAGLFHSDAQAAVLAAYKVYSDEPGMHVTVTDLKTPEILL